MILPERAFKIHRLMAGSLSLSIAVLVKRINIDEIMCFATQTSNVLVENVGCGEYVEHCNYYFGG